MNSEVAAAWFDTVKAPEKEIVWFEHSAHADDRGIQKVPPSLLRYAPADRGEGGRRSSVKFLRI